jgi:Na+/proline symporter
MNTSKIPLALGDSKDGHDFEKLVMWVSTASIAVMAGALASLKQVNPAIHFKFTAISVLAFVAGGVLTPLFLRVVLHANKRNRALLVVAAAIVSVLGYFLFGIKNTSQENRTDVTIGTAIAVTVLSFVAFLLWQLSRFLESDQQDRDNS